MKQASKKENRKQEVQLETCCRHRRRTCRRKWRKWCQIDLDPMNEIESLKIMHIYELHGYTMLHRGGNTMYSVAKLAILLKWPFVPCDPKWPQFDNWPHNIDRGSQADPPVWVLWSCYVTWTTYSILSENDLLTPVTPNDPRFTLDPIT